MTEAEPRKYPRKAHHATRERKLTAEFSCGHVVRFVSTPAPGDEVWCIRCDKAVTVTEKDAVA